MRPKPPYHVEIGWTPSEAQAYAVAVHSLYAQTTDRRAIVAHKLALRPLQDAGLYTRPLEHRDGRMWDAISEAPMSTEHAIARFFIPYTYQYAGWVLFTDGDVLFRCDVADLFARADDRYALMCVQHPPLLDVGTKKDGALQWAYPRKNWSSVMLFNCAHPAHRRLTLDQLNRLPGRDLHRFCWLDNREIGVLPLGWNYLVNVTAPQLDPDPAHIHLVHFTLGTPDVPDHAQDPFADEWRVALAGCCGGER